MGTVIILLYSTHTQAKGTLIFFANCTIIDAFFSEVTASEGPGLTDQGGVSICDQGTEEIA